MPEPVVLAEYDPSWPAQFEAEKARLMAALGYCTEGGVAYHLEHVGSTSIPGMAAKPCIDIAVDAYPFPIPEARVKALQDIGYEYLGEHGLAGRQFFRKGSQIHLHVVSLESEHGQRWILFRDYLRANLDRASAYQKVKRQLAVQHADDPSKYTGAKTDIVRELEREAYAWHIETTGFKPVEFVAEELEGLEIGWAISGGWALDLFLGAPTRYHHDLDISVWREDLPLLQKRLLERGWRVHKIVDKGKYAVWEPGERLEPSVHQVHARRGEHEFLDFVITLRDGDSWVYRRMEEIRLPIEQAIHVSQGSPHLAPEIMLLFKSATSSKDPRSKDQSDFERVLPKLPSERRVWLREALGRWKPGHPWLERL